MMMEAMPQIDPVHHPVAASPSTWHGTRGKGTVCTSCVGSGWGPHTSAFRDPNLHIGKCLG
eukprot:CAMPEP_0174360010 /NCGR_PEP_ID=MMETSP0811_2-20130205/51659_1 /TAXON_ID=73025 ORGANISM="Eutreptiella gymnastica-like, Strain CCMP1594" /NCGR_SAMPLE_ID=MMETSP0811_2 /ASSEMBLY_ACC=CAM_ASM_000667 /LENGTH=60 /DNA_ID=CAMNT_0015495239 /DNA_START=22 /DNA_END=204 /DNA_ORIENTATION=+